MPVAPAVAVAALRCHFLVRVGCPLLQSAIPIQAIPHACGAHHEDLCLQPFSRILPVHALHPRHVGLRHSETWSLLCLDTWVSGAPGFSSKLTLSLPVQALICLHACQNLIVKGGAQQQLRRDALRSKQVLPHTRNFWQTVLQIVADTIKASG